MNPENHEDSFEVTSNTDVVRIRDEGRALAKEHGFSVNEQTLIATAISEVCRNIIEYAGTGSVTFRVLRSKNGIGIEITATDNGPGIMDISRAMEDGYTTGKGMGLGLPGVKRIMDQFELISGMGEGTTVKMAKWRD
ncbi:MAG: anti-sigma regulatory factor [Candidatus Marinimicrobia bacterium]|nr:anti-sigma regulatory factor [Candidatus Neomarinimicrobiota bacterium]